jgi:putative IMPACT (imprinted ancient) family translation regulator
VKITRTGEAKLTVDRSRFYAVAFPAASLDEVQAAVRRLRSRHRKARHLCWACRLPAVDGTMVEQCRDDGEVGHPGRVLLELLRRDGLEGGLAVARIFGGVKLGVGGVSRAFRAAGEAALSAAKD